MTKGSRGKTLATIGIDIGKNGFHLIGLDVRCGSGAEVQRLGHLRPLLRAKPT